ncbi:GLUG motif-containing protein, partial [Xanthobacter sp. DSM 24535]|uniref:GLUG motif-containing protein n=1 Tax=Roseixanthobacter psychrophilus TaxID=3119917 RepID=UPI003726198D
MGKIVAAQGRTSRCRKCLAARALLLSSVALIVIADPLAGHAQQAASLPAGGSVVSGAAAISSPSATSVLVTQSSRNAIINWGSFSVGAGSSVRFENGSGATLNRVTGLSPSQLDGSLSATGSVYLVNPNGITVGPTGTVTTGGSFIASTHDVSDAEFNAGAAMTFKGSSTASVINYGSIGALGGDVALIARRVENAGTITAPNGTVGLAAGYEVLVRDATLSDGKFVVKVGGADTEAKTSGVIKAAEVELKANGGNVYALAGNTESITKATGVTSKGGRVFLTAGDGGSVTVSQKVVARAARSNGKAKGGEIQVSGGKVKVAGTLDAKGESDVGGAVTVTGSNLTLASGAVVDVSGATAGGTVRIGGDVQGSGTLAHAQTVTIEAGSVIKADATGTGTGGSVVVWSDGVTNFAGTISANGGALGGDGGFVETSGHELGFGAGLQVTTTAANGATGTWLLDPYNVTISNAADSFISVDTTSSPNTATPSGGSGTNLNVATLQSALASNNMVVLTSGAGSEAGNITVVNAVTWSANTTLTLNANTSTGGIFLNANVTGTGSGSGLVLNAGAGGINQTAASPTTIATSITVNTLNATTTNGGSVALTNSVNAITTLGTSSASGSFALTNGQDLNVSGPITSNGTLSLVTAAGDLNITAALNDSQAGASYTLSAANALNISKDLTLSGAGAQLNLSVGSSYSLVSGARVSLPDSGASLSINGQDYTLIHDAAGLQSVSGSGLYALGNDIDASATAGWNSGAGFQAIAGFSGTLAGFGHFVDSLTINRPGQSTQGLFGILSGTARDLTLSNVSINGNSTVGGVAGRLSGGTLSNVHVTGTVTGQGAQVGGLVGWSDIASIELSSSAASVSGTDEVGGLVGRNRVGSLTTSYATGAVTGTGSGIGGLVGTTVQGSALTDAYASGLVTGLSGTGGVVGSADGTTITSTNVYWDMDSTGQSASVVGSGFSSSSARTQSTYAGFDFSNVWVMIAGETRPMLRNEYSTVIATPAALQLMSQDLTASYRLGANINLTTAFTADGSGNYAGLWGASGFVPIGNSGTPFSGIFDGQGHSITGLTINRSGTNYVGLFGYTNGATISNVTLSAGSITGNDDVGSLIGYMLGGSVSSASASATVTGANTLETNVGGLVGVNDGGAISRASASGNVTGAGYQIGGLVGYLVNGGSITQSYATGDVTGTNTGAGMGYIGGLVGASGFTGNDGGTISQSYATGTVTGSSGPIGGFIGHNEGTITDAYATGRVIGLGSASNVGGFVGVNYTDGVITAAYSTGYVSGGAQVGGFAGYNNASASAITSAYWDTQTSGQASGIAGGSGGITARTTAQLQGTLPAGFSSSIWGTGTNLYPYFTWRYATTPVAVSGIAYSDAGTTALAGATVTAVSGGSALGSAVTGANGYYYVLAPSSALASSGVLTYLDNGTAKGAAFSDVDGTNGVQNVAIYGTAAHIITGESTLAATLPNYLAARGSYADTDLSFLSSTTFAPLTTTAGYGVYLNTTGNYTLNANLGSSGLLTIDSGGAFGVSGAITLAAAGALAIADAVSWSDASSLTLSTTSGGNISLAGAVTGAAGTLIVSASGTATTSSAVNVGTFRLDGGTWRQVAATLPSFAATNFVLGSGTTFLRATGGDGSAATPYQVGDVYGLQGVGSTSLLSQSFVLAADIDASGTSNWNSGSGFNPIGSDLDNFLGSFDGGGHTISGLVVTNSARAGLFGVIGNGATVSSLTVGGTVNGVVAGVLAAYNLGTVSNVKTSGTVLNAGNPNAGFAYLGGLVGIDQGNGSILNSSSSATVTNSQANTNAGGLAGASQNASISNSFATGAVTSTTATNTTTAGLVAANFGTITGSYATGGVSGGLYSGGLVAVNSGSISNAFATGSVSGATYAGGLVAVNAGTITGSYATGDVSGAVYSGGLVAVNSFSISNAFATGAVSGTTYAGGLVGQSYGPISNSYATGNVTAGTYAGGFIGYNNGAISNSYSTGSVSGATYQGGFIGYLSSGTVTASFWNTTTSGTALGIGAGSSTGVTGLTTAQLSSLSTFTGAGWDIDDAGGTGAVWRIYDGYTMPLLRSFMTALTVTGGSGSKTYDGSATSASVGTLTYNPSGYTTALVLGSALYTASGADAGSYSGAGLTLGGLYSSQLGYDITFVSGSLAIGQAALTATVTDTSKTYDGLAYSGGAGVTYSGFVAGETSAVL